MRGAPAPRGDDHPRNAQHIECLVDHGGRGVPRHCKCGARWPCPNVEEPVMLPDGCVGGHHPDLVSCELGADWL